MSESECMRSQRKSFEQTEKCMTANIWYRCNSLNAVHTSLFIVPHSYVIFKVFFTKNNAMISNSVQNCILFLLLHIEDEYTYIEQQTDGDKHPSTKN